jgi:hypothetical protein
MTGSIRDKYILFSAAAVSVLVLMCAVGSFNTGAAEGNGLTEITGMISDPVPSQNGTVFKVTDLGGNEFRCFYRSALPEAQTLCKLIGSFSADGNMFFVSAISTL